MEPGLKFHCKKSALLLTTPLEVVPVRQKLSHGYSLNFSKHSPITELCMHHFQSEVDGLFWRKFYPSSSAACSLHQYITILTSRFMVHRISVLPESDKGLQCTKNRQKHTPTPLVQDALHLTPDFASQASGRAQGLAFSRRLVWGIGRRAVGRETLDPRRSARGLRADKTARAKTVSPNVLGIPFASRHPQQNIRRRAFPGLPEPQGRRRASGACPKEAQRALPAVSFCALRALFHCSRGLARPGHTGCTFVPDTQGYLYADPRFPDSLFSYRQFSHRCTDHGCRNRCSEGHPGSHPGDPA